MAGGWSTPRPSRFTPKKNPVPTGWAPGLFWTGATVLKKTVLNVVHAHT